MGTETELKLQLDPAVLQSLRSHPLVKSLKQGRPFTRFEKSVYFDTKDLRLRRQQAVLRVRHIGRRRIQTLKMVHAGGSAWSRREWEAEITGDQPEWQPLDGTDLTSFAKDEAALGRLHPIFATEVRRTLYRLGQDDWEIELVLDQGQLIAGQRSAPISEAELELKSGDVRHLFEVALALQNDFPLRLSVTSKAERGFALAEGVNLRPQKAAVPQLAPDISAGEACRSLARACVGQLAANQDCLLDTLAPEAIHQMRVALRRLRSAMALFKGFLDTPGTARLRDELRWLQGKLGPARDADVFIAEIIEPVATALVDLPGMARLRDDFLARRQAAFGEALAALSLPRHSRLMLRLAEWAEGGDWLFRDDAAARQLIDEPARTIAQASLAKRDRKLRRGMRQLAELDDSARHKLRIDLKKLRYSAEFFSSLYQARRTKRLTRALGVLQDRLGLINDIVVGRARLKDVSEEASDKDRLWAAGIVAGWHAAATPVMIGQAIDDWQQYEKMPKFWEARP